MERATTSIVMGENPSLEKWQELDHKVTATPVSGHRDWSRSGLRSKSTRASRLLLCRKGCNWSVSVADHVARLQLNAYPCTRVFTAIGAGGDSFVDSMVQGAVLRNTSRAYLCMKLSVLVPPQHPSHIRGYCLLQLSRLYWAACTRKTLCSGRHQTVVGSAFVSPDV